MKRVTVEYFCDLCKKKVEFEKIKTLYIGHYEEGYMTPVSEKEFHLHEDCLQEVVDFESLEGEEEQEEPEEKPKKKREFDYGKLTALKNAGWSVKDIAREMKTNESNIYYRLNKMKEENNE